MAVWVTATDLVQHYRDSQSDMSAAELGPAYAWGGVEFYEKVRLDPSPESIRVL